MRQSVPFLLVMIPCPVNATPKTSAYKIAARGRAPLDTAPCPGRVSPLEEMIRRYADKPIRQCRKPEIRMSFDSLWEAYDFL